MPSLLLFLCEKRKRKRDSWQQRGLRNLDQPKKTRIYKANGYYYRTKGGRPQQRTILPDTDSRADTNVEMARHRGALLLCRDVRFSKLDSLLKME
eukprot:12324511-Ditylum_brightwellii.AAC.1